jgi:HSP20 family molecular chaperone IbpA
LKNYYIDIELPGVECKDQIKLKWTNSRTLFLEVEKTSRAIVEDADGKPVPKQAGKEPPATEPTHGTEVQETGEGIQTATKKKDEPEHAVHHIIKERELGRLKRAFNFPVAVDREGMTAKLHHGILEITLAKNDEDEPIKHEVSVEQHTEVTPQAAEAAPEHIGT